MDWAASKKYSINLSTTFVIVAALCWGLSGGIGGILTSHGWDPIVVSFYRGTIGLFFVLTWLALRPHGSGLANPQLWFWSIIGGGGVAGNFVFYFMSIAQGSVAVAATLMYCAPVFVYLASFMLKLEKPTGLKCAAIAMVMLGVVLLTGVYSVGASEVSLIAAGAGLLSALSYAIFIFGFKYAAPHGSPQAILTIAFAILAVLLMALSDTRQALAVLGAPGWPLFVILGVLGAGVSFIFYIIGLKHTAPAMASMIAMVEPITATLFGVAFLNERLIPMQVLGMVLILVTVTALGVYSSARRGSSATVPLADQDTP